MISFTEFALKHPQRFREALAEMDIERLAELMDQGDEAWVGRVVTHVIDISIHQEKLVIPRLEPITKKCRQLGPLDRVEEEPRMYLRQCD